MKSLHIENSYNVWIIDDMRFIIQGKCFDKYGSRLADNVLNRTYRGMYIEWYIHNIGYWLTLPFIDNEGINKINQRFKHVDLEEHT